MSSINTWNCDGEPKNGKQYPNCSGPHPPYENYGADCVICGLPKEAMTAERQKTQKTVMSTRTKSTPPIPVLVGIGFILALVAGFGLYKFYQSQHKAPVAETSNSSSSTSTPTTTPSNTTTPTSTTATGDSQAFVSATAANPRLISQGEKILFTNSINPQKTQGANAFAQKNWDSAIAQYQQAISANPNDPESKIYLNNAKAQKAGSPITIAIGVPITPNPSAAQEVLRGVALAQDQFNSSPRSPGRLLQVVLVNEAEVGKAAAIAQDVVKSPNVLGVLAQGIDSDSRASAAVYQQAGLAIISPISTSISPGVVGKSTLKTISPSQKASELAGAYLKQATTSLAKYVSQKQSPANAVIFYDASSPSSQEMKTKFVEALGQVKGKVVKEVDVTSPNLNAATELKSASQAGAKVAFLALGKNKAEQAVAIAKANSSGGSQLQLLGGDELYDPNLLIQGGDAIKGIVLAVPWSWQPNDPFATQSSSLWKGRVSWRTATAHDATAALASAVSQQPTRSGVVQLFNQGIPLPEGTATNFNVFNQIPLVQAVKGSNGPPGSNYEFDPL